ncbi:MAG: glutamate-5-semialdehyde dehydrogenase [Desulfobacteraceae bacterium]|nr:glutamate-5-semialdehyde dehydrogenase [Desulfobacteraceae bacterium]
MTIQDLASGCKKAAIFMAALSADVKNKALSEIVAALYNHQDIIIKANQKDLEQARGENLDPPLLKRLKFDADKIKEACQGLESLIALEDPVNDTQKALELDTGLELYKVSRPIGVIGVIFESRPDALVQIASLCLKSGNAVLLKGGSEAAGTNAVLARIISDATMAAQLPLGWLGLLETREDVADMLCLDHYIDLIIPRGSNAFVRHIMDNTVIPVLGHADGICHLYIDKFADHDMAIELAVDGKCQYVAVCNATETILVHEIVASQILPPLKAALEKQNVEIRGCKKACGLIDVKQATKEDWQTEYLDYIVSIKVAASMSEALEHINTYGSGHTDVIVTNQKERAVSFMDLADTADAFWNCSSRFSDGFRFGLGAEVGISTNKIHARGPVGLEGLMIYQWRLMGKGHKVADYAGQNARSFSHKPLGKPFQ